MATSVRLGVVNDPASRGHPVLPSSSCQMASMRAESRALVSAWRVDGGNVPRRHAHMDKVKAGTPKAA